MNVFYSGVSCEDLAKVWAPELSDDGRTDLRRIGRIGLSDNRPIS